MLFQKLSSVICHRWPGLTKNGNGRQAQCGDVGSSFWKRRAESAETPLRGHGNAASRPWKRRIEAMETPD